MAVALIEIKGDSSHARREIESLTRSFSRFGQQVRTVASMASQSVTGLRQIAQGFQNLGFVLTAFVTLPVTKAMSDMTKSMLEFENTMVEVAKTTGLPNESIQTLSERIRELGKATPTTQMELATLAAEAGRVGVAVGKSADQAVKDIMEFVRVTDMMQVATVLTGEEAAQAFGRLIAVLEDIGVGDIEKLGSAINELGQSASVNEEQIINAMLRIAPAAAALGLKAPDVAALGTAIVQLSESAARGGTRARSALESLGVNFDKAAKLIGMDAAQMEAALREDAMEVFMRIVEVASKSEDRIAALGSVFKAFGSTGSNAIMRLAAGFDTFNDLMGISRAAFADGTSLQNEFNRAMTSTQNILKTVGNNLREVGMEFLTNLMPIAKEFLGAMIPAIQELGAWVSNLTVKQKLLIAGLAAFLVVGLPIVALLGSFGFAITMVVNGIVNFIGGLASLIATLVTLGSVTGAAQAVFTLLAGAMAGLGIIAVLKFTGALGGITEKLQELVDAAAAWGERLIGEFAGGLIQGVGTFLVDALNYIGDVIASFLAPGSPPETGPLSTINNWGKRLMDIFLQGFKNADFSILQDVTRIIEHILKGMVDAGILDEKQLGPAIDKARTLIAELIKVFNETGEISEDILAKIESMLGEAGDEVAKLLRLQLKYNKALEEMTRINQKMDEVEEAYKAQIRMIQARTDLTAAEKLELIRRAREEKNLTLGNLSTQKSATQKQIDGLKEQLEWMKAYISAMMKTDDIWSDHFKALDKATKKIAKALGRVGKAIEDVLAKLLDQLDINKKMQAIYEEQGLDTTSLLREELSIRKKIIQEILKRKAALEGKQIEGTISDEELAELDRLKGLLDDNIARVSELERVLNVKVDPLSGIDQIGKGTWTADQLTTEIKSIQETVAEFSKTVDKGRESWELFKAGLSGGPKPPPALTGLPLPQGGDIAQVEDPYGKATEGAIDFYEAGSKIRETIDSVKGKFDELKSKVTTTMELIKTTVATVIDTIKQKVLEFGSAFSGIGEVSSEVGMTEMKNGIFRVAAEDASTGIEKIGEFAAKFKGLLPVIMAVVGGFLLFRGVLGSLLGFLGVGKLLESFGTEGTIANTSLKGLGKGLMETKSGLLGLASASKGVFGGVSTDVAMPFKLLADQIRDFTTISPIASSQFNILGGTIKGAFLPATGLAGKFTTLSMIFSNLVGAGGSGLGAVISGLGSLIGTLAGGAATIASFTAAVTAIGAIVVAAGVVIAAMAKYIMDNWEEFKKKFKGIFDSVVNGITGFVENFKKALGLGQAEGKGFGEMLGEIYKKAKPIARFLSNVLVKAFQFFGDIIEALLPALGTLIGGFFRGIGQAAIGIIDFISGIIEVVAGIVDALTGKDADWSRATEGLKQAFSGIVEFLAGIGAAIVGVFRGIIEFVLGVIDGLLASMQEKFGEIGIVTWVRNAIQDVIAWFEWLYQMLIGGSIIPDLVNGIIEWFSSLPAKFKEWMDGILANFSWTDLINGISTGLANIAIAITNWIFGTGIPAFEEWVQGVKDYLRENIPKWVISLMIGLAKLIVAIRTWVNTKALPAIRKFIDDGAEKLKQIGTIWKSKVSLALLKLKLAFMSLFKQIGDGIKARIKTGMNGVISIVEKAINRIIGKVNSLIGWINSGLKALNLPTIGEANPIRIPRLAGGGIALSPTLAMIGDVAGGEAIIPLRDLESVIGAATEQPRQNIEIQINNPVVRSDEDLRQIIDAVTREIGFKMTSRTRNLGRALG